MFLGGESGPSQPEILPNDFSLYVGKTLTDSEKLSALEDHFKPHKLYQFPQRNEYGKNRSFNPAWLDEYPWLVYSPAEDGVYCKVCSIFGGVSSDKNSSKIERLVKVPITFWTSASSKLKDHQMKSGVHKSATLKAEEFYKVIKLKQKSIGEQLNSALASQIQHNREKLYSIVKTILFCGRQNIAIRGHREYESSTNPGNFRELLSFRIESGDHLLQDHLCSAPKNATYTSNTIQNDLIHTVGKWIQNKILSEIQQGSNIFTVIADESRDCSNKEQMPLIVRYVDKHSSIVEAFLAFVECEYGTSGEQLATLIESACQNIGLDMSLCRGQGYDGAGNMAGLCTGAAKRIRDKYPKAFYFHCAAHRLNLCVAHALKLTSVSNMFSVITSTANFFNYSPKRQKSLEIHVGKYPSDALKTKLLPLCRTRWVERINALEVSLDLLEAVVLTFCSMVKNIDKEWNRDTVNQASSLLKNIDFDFIINLVIVQKVLAFTSGITTGLQKRGIDVVDVCTQVQLVIRTLQGVRSEVEGFHGECFIQACVLARKLDVDIKKPRICARQVHRQNAVATSSGELLTHNQQVEKHYCINVTIPVLDDVIVGLCDRFCEGQEDVMKGSLLIPSNIITKPNWESLIQPFLELYLDEVPSNHTLSSELLVWKQLWMDKWSSHMKLLQEQNVKIAGKEINYSDAEVKRLKFSAVPNTVCLALSETNQDVFPNVHYLLTVLGVLPLTTCEAERTISCLRRLKTYMRSTMTQDRLTGLALMHIHRELSLHADVDEIVQSFATEHPRRMKLYNILDS